MTVTLHLGDCLEYMRTLEPGSVDAVITDPPYELGFMGKAWDRTGIAYNVEMWQEALRVLKPGGHLLAFGGTRTYHRMAVAIEDAGFEIRDQLQWLYGSGFPKSLDVSKAIDKAAGAEREAVGTRMYGNGHVQHSSPDKLVPPIGTFARTQDDRIITAPATPDAERWDGWGTALKPANEPVCMARKPLAAATVAANVLQYGTGALNVDACRIGTTVETWPASRGYSRHDPGSPIKQTQPTGDVPSGRWPANVLLDEEAAAMLDEQSGELTSGARKATGHKRNGVQTYGFVSDRPSEASHGGASRFFYCAKASRSERNRGCEGMPERPLLWSSGTQNPGSFQAENTNRAASNYHPTVKPVALMRWLVQLVTPEGGTVLDPMMGSGTTGIACEELGRGFIGCELDPGYFAIAERRIHGAQLPLFVDQDQEQAA